MAARPRKKAPRAAARPAKASRKAAATGRKGSAPAGSGRGGARKAAARAGRRTGGRGRSTAEAAGVSSADVNLGHVFALRPRANTSFRPDDFRRARQMLDDQRWPTVQEAARAVAEKALELTHEASGTHTRRAGRA